uniref:Uncharacterized protein n=1 Tax=Cyclopterus lumpus TaxID=8103 RepID=A0A8C2Z237_CYCLU
MLTDMSSIKLSAVLEKQIQRLCLNDFPCGYGTWRFCSQRKTKDSPEEAETEDIHALLDLLSCPHSPWRHETSWSPQAPALRQLAVLTPERLHTDFIYNYFTALRIVGKDVSVIDDSLLKFSKLEELVLSDNRISEIPPENLPSTLKILELRANRLSALNSLTNCLPPRLEYLSLGSNSLVLRNNTSCSVKTMTVSDLRPQLVSLDLSDCEFKAQQALLSALSTLTCLRTLVLEGNPFTLAPSYPGFTVDSLPQLSCLDTTESLDENAPVVTYAYFITYDCLNTQKKIYSHTFFSFFLHFICFLLPYVCAKFVLVYYSDFSTVSGHSTSKLTWSECMDFSHTQTYIVSDLGGLKRFFNRGLYLTIEEEKVKKTWFEWVTV